MKKRNNNMLFRTSLICLLTWAATVTVACADTVTIQLKNGPVPVFEQPITIGDVAEITAMTEVIVNRIAKLDLDYLEDGQTESSVSRLQVQMRLLVDGMDADQLNFRGPQQVRFHLAEKSNVKRVIEKFLTNAFSEQFAVSLKDVRIRVLDTANTSEIAELSSAFDSALVIFPADLPFGKHDVRIEYRNVQGDESSLHLSCQFTILQELVVAKRPINRGAIISESHVARVKRPFDNANIVPASFQDCIGKQASTDIPVHRVMRTSHIADAKKQILVKRGSLINVWIRRRGLVLKLGNAKALTAGAKGETVEVLNPDTNKKLSAEVVDKANVEIK